MLSRPALGPSFPRSLSTSSPRFLFFSTSSRSSILSLSLFANPLYAFYSISSFVKQVIRFCSGNAHCHLSAFIAVLFLSLFSLSSCFQELISSRELTHTWSFRPDASGRSLFLLLTFLPCQPVFFLILLIRFVLPFLSSAEKRRFLNLARINADVIVIVRRYVASRSRRVGRERTS